MFAAADREAMFLGISMKTLLPAVLSEHIVLLNGVQNRADYGRLVSFNEEPDASAWIHTRRQLMVGEALLVLKLNAA